MITTLMSFMAGVVVKAIILKCLVGRKETYRSRKDPPMKRRMRKLYNLQARNRRIWALANTITVTTISPLLYLYRYLIDFGLMA